MALWVGMTEFQSYLIGAGVLTNPLNDQDPQAFLPFEDALAASQDDFEQRTGWLPFVWDAAYDATGEPIAQTRYFDAEGQRLLDLQGGVLRLESVLIGSSAYDTASIWPGPPNALARGLPYTYLELRAFRLWHPGSLPGKRAIAVSGDWGRFYTLPYDAKMAVMAGALLMLGPALMARMGQGALEWHTSETGEKERDQPLSGAFAGVGKGAHGAGVGGAQELVDRTVMKYRRAKLS